MTRQEHAERIQRRLERVENNLKALHNALADAMKEHGADIGLEGDVMTASFAPK